MSKSKIFISHKPKIQTLVKNQYDIYCICMVITTNVLIKSASGSTISSQVLQKAQEVDSEWVQRNGCSWAGKNFSETISCTCCTKCYRHQIGSNSSFAVQNKKIHTAFLLSKDKLTKILYFATTRYNPDISLMEPRKPHTGL